MTDTYEDAEPDETVFVSGVGNMSLRSAVRRYLEAREHGLLVSLFRDAGKMPSVFDAVDVERLSKLKRFRVLAG
ncbi:hypothetical protein [Lichenifustis flavocetrariae]|uniref:Uncharacterized protein n=1 Tax=Lichenifustis flavocetrariae TaxID=2949735 RepID=A0AA41Z3P7_9HYPH|nr:hypothetical protein [Lichenifustis flavocetrariae]MCW6508697.1 hypothetical protein [Lichenifustis flavocetrariae]